MKKWIFFVGCLLLVAVLLIYILIPSTLTITRIEPLRCKAVSVWPWVSEEAQWGAWWRDSAERKDFHIQGLSYQAVDIRIKRGEQLFDSRLTLMGLGNQDSSLLQWETRWPSGWNPVNRIRQYLVATRLRDAMDGILAQARVFADKKENLYGTEIRMGGLRDTLLIAIRKQIMRKPTNEDIYEQVSKLSHYVSTMHCHQTNSPIANISPDTSRAGGYRLMVAMPVDCRLEGGGEFAFKRLIPWKYLIGEVRGGTGAVDIAFQNMDRFIRDYQLTVMAIPFQMLVTDRRQERDSSRWVTRIYYPVF